MITGFYTCKRPTPYIGETLSSYFDFRDEIPFIFEQEGTDPYLNRTRVSRILSPASNLIDNWFFMVKWLHDKTYDEVYMLCEDDIVFNRMPDLIPMKLGFLSLYSSKINVKDEKNKGWVKPHIGSHGFCGALCVIFSRLSLEEIVKNEEKFRTLTRGLHLDYAIGEFFKDEINYVHYPTAVLHIGEISTREGNNTPENKVHPTRMPAL